MNDTKKDLSCFVCASCSYQCPNLMADAYCDRFDISYSDICYEELDCKECSYNVPSCDNCLFQHCRECPNPEYYNS